MSVTGEQCCLLLSKHENGKGERVKRSKLKSSRRTFHAFISISFIRIFVLPTSIVGGFAYVLVIFSEAFSPIGRLQQLLCTIESHKQTPTSHLLP